MEKRKQEEEKWEEYTRIRRRADDLRRDLLLSDARYLVVVLHRALSNPGERLYALEMVSQLLPEVRKEFLPDLVGVASFAGPQIFMAREIILSFPRDWLLANIAFATSPLLQRGGDEEYRRIIELYRLIDRDMAHELVLRAAVHENVEVRAVAHDFLGEEPGEK